MHSMPEPTATAPSIHQPIGIHLDAEIFEDIDGGPDTLIVATDTVACDEVTSARLRGMTAAARSKLDQVDALADRFEAAQAATAEPRTWTFTRSDVGEKAKVTCMPGCTLDHQVDVDGTTHPHDIGCHIPTEGVELPLLGPMCETGSPEPFQVLGFQIDVQPFAPQLSHRLPHLNLQVVDDHYVENLDPDALTTVIRQLQQQVDRLRTAHTELVRLRAEYTGQQA